MKAHIRSYCHCCEIITDHTHNESTEEFDLYVCENCYQVKIISSIRKGQTKNESNKC